MVKVEFTNDMYNFLSNIKGDNFISYNCIKDKFSRAYGNLRINLNNYALTISNEIKALPFFDNTEDLSCFSCEKTDLNDVFKPAIEGTPDTYKVNDVINSVEILKNIINVNHGEYVLSSDAALIIRMQTSTIMFARDIWFSELITIRNNDDYHKVISTQDIIDSLSNGGEYDVEIKESKLIL